MDPGLRRDDRGNVTVVSITTVIPAKGVVGVSCSVLHARGTALACKSVRALQGGIHFFSGTAP